MYGKSETQVCGPFVRYPEPPKDVARESVLSINQETLNLLYDANNALEGLTAKFEGPSISNKGQDAPEPIRSLADDARRIRGLASSILGRIQYLHDSIGKN